jgi:hypothetical protein
MKATWITVLLVTSLSRPGWGQAQPQPRFPLTASQVARALSERGVQTDGEQVALLASVVATEPNPTLDVLSVETLGNAQSPERSRIRSRVKLACREAEKCLPFYALVNWPEGTAWAVTVASSSSPVQRNPAVSSPAAKNVPANFEVTMPAGTHAILVMDDHRSHIQLSVISLENGLVGHRIRVASPDHKQFYLGEVVSPSLLKGSF